jgi:hypothetical protein
MGSGLATTAELVYCFKACSLFRLGVLVVVLTLTVLNGASVILLRVTSSGVLLSSFPDCCRTLVLCCLFGPMQCLADHTASRWMHPLLCPFAEFCPFAEWH